MINKEQFIRIMAEEKNYTIKDTRIIVNDFLDVMENLIVNGEAVRFHGFGTFSSIERRERESFDVNTGERIVIPAFRSPKFEAGENLKRSVRDGYVREA